MNTKMSKLALAIGALVMAGGAMAQSTATEAAATANANVIRPITIAKDVSLEFGNIVAGAGTVIIAASAAGTRTDSAAALTPGTQKGTVNAATFNVTGEGAATYAITLPADGAVILKNGAGGTAVTEMVLSGFTKAVKSAGTLLTLEGSAGGAGTQSFYVGATLTGVASQVPGAYTANYSVTVAYN
ncbi:hypothetical protein RCH06_003492 [Polaromonas sp. CG_9.5]|uniref:DUF4402 domain-containing protein n=1 Tax=Polaromonas sp. CG_9.5 TaxID=3071705 RepID=UPI002DF7DCBE|nr:hypothetical protein [Polaromonas sp. CG_9.5]